MIITVCLLLIAIIGSVVLFEINNYKKKNKKILDNIRYDWEHPYHLDTDDITLQDLYKSYICLPNKSNNEIDDITWNDLEMNGIYKTLNYTKSSLGENFLYKMLREPLYNIALLKEREQIINLFYTNDDLRNKQLTQLTRIGKRNRLSIWEFKNNISKFTFYSLLPHRLYPIFMLITILIIPINMVWGVILSFIMLSVNVFSYYSTKEKIEYYIPLLVEIGSMLTSIKGLSEKTGHEIIDKYTCKLAAGAKLNKKFNKYILKIRTMIFGYTTDIDTLVDYIRIVTHMDLIAFIKLINYVNKNMELIQECYEIVGYIDSMLSLTIFKRQHSLIYKDKYSLCVPELSDKNKAILFAKDIYNPLLKDAVKNTVDITKSMLITGSNATGKSTFLRTIGINAILAQTIYMVCGQEYKGSLFKIFTSMKIEDNIYEANSTYMMEIKSIKRILDATVDGNITILCCMDEVLRGTNTIERIGAASEILKSLSFSNVLCLAATHDIELSYILEESYNNYHFQEKVIQDNILFDYKLYNGRSYTRNAIQLLKLLGYSDSIVSKAVKKVDDYLATGKWV